MKPNQRRTGVASDIQAADMVRIMGVGRVRAATAAAAADAATSSRMAHDRERWPITNCRTQNEYIGIMEKCKSKKLLWRVNKSYARELLPREPLPVQLLPWHLMQVVNMGACLHAGSLIDLTSRCQA